MVPVTITRRGFTTRALALALGGYAAVDARASASPGVGAPASVTSDVSAASYCPDGEEQAFLGLINQYRANNGLGPVSNSATLGAAAEQHSRDMAYHNYFSHTLFSGRSWLDNIRAMGYRFRTSTGENIAAGHSSAGETFTQWRNSPPHRANTLNGAFTAIGIGRASNSRSRYRWYWTTTFGGVFDEGPRC
ncbi:MAG: CAP domain-containing protein [Thermomicrobiales bacterium]